MSSVGKVRDVKLIVCNKTRRFKGIAYVEFKDLESVPLVIIINQLSLRVISFLESKLRLDSSINFFPPLKIFLISSEYEKQIFFIKY